LIGRSIQPVARDLVVTVHYGVKVHAVSASAIRVVNTYNQTGQILAWVTPYTSNI